eukprot:2660450-Rhodomonas_salina.1
MALWIRLSANTHQVVVQSVGRSRRFRVRSGGRLRRRGQRGGRGDTPRTSAASGVVRHVSAVARH